MKRTATVIALCAAVLSSLLGCRLSEEINPWAFLSEEERTAVSLCEVQLHRLAKLTTDAPVQADLGSIVPIHALGSDEPSMYEVKLVTPDGADSGYVLANLDRRDFPIPGFALTGPTLSECMTAEVGSEDYTLVRLTPNCYVAYDEDGNVLATLGDVGAVDDEDVEDACRYDEEVAAASDLESLYAFVATTMDDVYTDIAVDVAASWAELDAISNQARGYTDHIFFDLDQDMYTAGSVFAEGCDAGIDVDQISAHDGPNSAGYSSGCGPAAWTVFLTWHDQLWAPDLLRGSEISNSGPYGIHPPVIDPLDNLYIDRVQVDLMQYLGTYNSCGQGATLCSRFDDGFNYIENVLDTSYSGYDYNWRRSERIQEVYDHLCADSRPLLMFMPWHYTVIAGLVFNEDSSEARDQYLYMHPGWGSDMAYMQARYMRRYWYLREIQPPTLQSYPIVASRAPSIVTTRNDDGELAQMWMFSRSDTEGKIYWTRSPSSGVTVDNIAPLTYGSVLQLDGADVLSPYPPAVAVDDQNRVMLAYVDDAHRIHLYRNENDGKPWTALQFPSTITTDVQPAISGGQGDWFTIAFSNADGVQMMGTNRDLQRSDAWPTTRSGIQADCFWYKIDYVSSTDEPIHMTRFQDNHTVVAWADAMNMAQVKLWVSMIDGTRGVQYYNYPDQAALNCAPSLVVSNNTVFMCYHGSGRIYLDVVLDDTMTPFYEPNWSLNVRVASIAQTAGQPPSLAAVVLENGKHPMLVPAWSGPGGRGYFLLASVDWPEEPLDYTGVPIP